jgi:hypothetical protein
MRRSLFDGAVAATAGAAMLLLVVMLCPVPFIRFFGLVFYPMILLL